MTLILARENVNFLFVNINVNFRGSSSSSMDPTLDPICVNRNDAGIKPTSVVQKNVRNLIFNNAEAIFATTNGKKGTTLMKRR